MEMLRSMNMANLSGVQLQQVRIRFSTKRHVPDISNVQQYQSMFICSTPRFICLPLRTSIRFLPEEVGGKLRHQPLIKSCSTYCFYTIATYAIIILILETRGSQGAVGAGGGNFGNKGGVPGQGGGGGFRGNRDNKN
jgi:hypothetical protein